jgi:two-component system, chemotaxis family, protein-glutamate methylesterase/glutaminase
MLAGRNIRVLIVDDSAIVRRILSEALSGEPDIEVVGTAPDPYVARDKILALRPDVLTLDIEMPRMDGLTFLKKLMQFHPMPAIVISSLAQPSCHAALQALQFGAVEVLAKPGGPYSVGELRHNLVHKVRAAAMARIRKPEPAPIAARPGDSPEARPAATAEVKPVAPVKLTAQALPPGTIVAIGASTGGTEAIANILSRIPQNCPGIVITQHIPAQFSRAFAKRLNDSCAMEVKEAEDGDTVRGGLALIAPGDFHMLLRKSVGRYYVNVKTGPRVCYQRPSVDVLFSSVAEAAGGDAVAALLTGMGNDGAQGMLRLKQAGAYTIAQNEATCVVYGMPREAVELGAAMQVLPLHAIAEALLAPRSKRMPAPSGDSTATPPVSAGQS